MTSHKTPSHINGHYTMYSGNDDTSCVSGDLVSDQISGIKYEGQLKLALVCDVLT